MKAYTQLNYNLSQAAVWMTEHPTAVRVALIVLPILLALGMALFTYDTSFACPLGGSGGTAGSGGGGGCKS
jgi:hypothetical protein